MQNPCKSIWSFANELKYLHLGISKRLPEGTVTNKKFQLCMTWSLLKLVWLDRELLFAAMKCVLFPSIFEQAC